VPGGLQQSQHLPHGAVGAGASIIVATGLGVKGVTIGALNLLSHDGAYTPADEAVVTAFGAHVAVASAWWPRN